jgi:hypothetical protein
MARSRSSMMRMAEPQHADVLVEREIDRIANTLCPLAEREQRIAKLEEEIDRLQRTEEAIVVATDASREAGCPPCVVLGVTAIEAHGMMPDGPTNAETITRLLVATHHRHLSRNAPTNEACHVVRNAPKPDRRRR